MKRLLALLFIFAATASSMAYTLSTWTMTVTNGTTANDAYSVNGVVVRGGTNRTSSTFATNNTATLSTTNIFSQIGGWPFAGVIVSNTSSTNILFQGVGLVMTASNFAKLASNGVVISISPWPLMIPQESYPASTRASNAANLVTMLQLSSNAFPETANLFSNFVSRGQTQFIGNKVLTNSLFGGVVSNSMLTNISSALITNISAPTAFIGGGSLSNVVLTNIAGASGTLGNLTNGVLQSVKLTNASGELRNFYASNGIVVGLTVTNLDSPGSGSQSQRIGSGASASGFQSIAFGVSALATNSASIAIGSSSASYTQNGISIGAGSYTDTTGSQSISIGTEAGATGPNSIAIGAGAVTLSTHTNSVIVGAGAASTEDHQIRLGTSSEHVSIPGELRDVRATNTVLRGTNVLNGRIDLTPRSNTGLANGYNSAVLVGTNAYVYFSGPSAAYTNAGFVAPGGPQFVVCQFDNPGLSFTLLDSSGLEGTAANRILTGTGALLNSTNNPAMATLIYDSSSSRWRVISFR